jgi:dTMP kinase
MSLACEAFLFMASRAELTTKVVAPALAAGKAVVADRYLLANVVYQGHAGGLDPKLLWEMGTIATDGLEPDLTLVLDLAVNSALARRAGGADRVESRDSTYHERVRAGFLAEAQKRPNSIRVVEAVGSIADLHERICREVASVLATRSRT